MRTKPSMGASRPVQSSGGPDDARASTTAGSWAPVAVSTAPDTRTGEQQCHLINLSALSRAPRDRGELVASRPLSEIKAELFKALAHPGRVRILEILRDGEHTVTELVPLVGLEASHLSQQLAVLRRARIVTTRREG